MGENSGFREIGDRVPMRRHLIVEELCHFWTASEPVHGVIDYVHAKGAVATTAASEDPDAPGGEQVSRAESTKLPRSLGFRSTPTPL